MANEIYKKTWWGNLTNSVGWGSIYKNKINEITKEKSKKDKSK